MQQDFPVPCVSRFRGCSWRFTKYETIVTSGTSVPIASHGYVLTPGRYVGAEEQEDDGEPFEEKMSRLVAKLEEQFAESARLEKVIRTSMKGLGL